MQDYVSNSEWRTLNITECILRNNTGTEYLNYNQVHKIKMYQRCIVDTVSTPCSMGHAALGFIWSVGTLFVDLTVLRKLWPGTCRSIKPVRSPHWGRFFYSMRLLSKLTLYTRYYKTIIINGVPIQKGKRRSFSPILLKLCNHDSFNESWLFLDFG